MTVVPDFLLETPNVGPVGLRTGAMTLSDGKETALYRVNSS
jgi:hypothetical protein